MADLAELKRRYPKLLHGPDPACKRCGGSGERALKGGGLSGGGIGPCLCLYVDHDLVDLAAVSLAGVAASIRADPARLRRDMGVIAAEIARRLGKGKP